MVKILRTNGLMMAALNNAKAKILQNEAALDYIAMMADIEMPTESEGEK